MRGTKPKPDRLAAGRLTSRAGQVKEDQLLKPAPSGLQQLKLERERDGYIYVPAGYSTARPAPLILLLHGAGGNARQSIPLLQHLADRSGMILLAPDSRQPTWDVIVDGYGPDVAFIDRALDQTFSSYAVDPAYIGIGGFSDGASYALSLGLTNGDLFTHVLAFSPGFMAPAGQHGAPALFISHGTQDRVLPIDLCSRRLVPQVERAGYRVHYREFAGPHTVPPEITRAAVDWFLKDKN
jgi:phospholipase/carboxylesterase